MIDDAELLRCYTEEKSEDAFAELVRRHVNFVYASALRRVGGDAHFADDVTQRVFMTLAREAVGLARREVLSGWLYVTTRNAAAQIVRGERRRVAREQAAHFMNELTSAPAHDTEWERLRPVIDGAMDELRDGDREAVLLRFFEGKTFGEIAAKLRLTENAARMRVERALDALQMKLARRGITSTAVALSGALSGQAAVAAPVGLAASVTAGAVAGGGSVAAHVISMTMAKSKLALTITGVVLMSGAALLWEQRTHDRQQRALREETSKLQRQVAALLKEARENAGLRAENTRLTEALAGPAAIAKMTGSGVDSGAGAPAASDEKKSRDAWRNVGRATPVGTYETVMWASDRGDLDVLVSAFVLSAAQRAEADAFFKRLPDETRAKYATPERMMALLFASGTPAAWQLLTETATGAEDVVVRARVWNDRGETNELDLPFHRYSDGWRVVIPDWHMNKSLARLKK